MTHSSRHQTQNELPILSAGARFLEAQEFTPELPKTLLLKLNGQPFAEIALGLTNTSPQQPNWLLQLDYLAREEPIGGWEPLLLENKNLALDHALAQLGKRLAEPSGEISARQFLADVKDAAHKLKRELDEQQRTANERYVQAYARLRKWQQEYDRDKNMLTRLVTLGGALLGGQISVYDAGQNFNKRETFAKWRDAFGAASEITAKLIEIADGYARNLDALVIAARQASVQAQTQRAQLETELAKARPYTYTVDYARVAELLCGAENDPATLAELLTTLREQGSERLAEQAATLARRDAERLAGTQDLVQWIELEGQAMVGADEENDPVVLVGETLLDQVLRQQPTWQLTRQARPRHEVVQITPQGEMLFNHPDLKTARYGDRTDRLGFLSTQMQVALDELQLIREGQEAFQRARERREYFVLEQVAAAFPLIADDAAPTQNAKTPESLSPFAPILANDDGHYEAEA